MISEGEMEEGGMVNRREDLGSGNYSKVEVGSRSAEVGRWEL